MTACAVAFGLGALFAGCATLPPLGERRVSTAIDAEQTVTTRLGRAIAPRAAAHPGESGIQALADGHGAFAARVLLTRLAERSLDVLYYIWHPDLSGPLMLQALRDAADRGVRVRLLLDDNGIAGMDDILTTLDAHPHIEVRLFNPFAIRGARVLGYLSDFSRLNRRMHNKSFTADNQATIVGGRNIADAYFDAGDGALFVDLDVLAVGPVVPAVSDDFDRYWSSESAYPIDRLTPPVDAAHAAELAATAAAIVAAPAAAAYRDAVRDSPFVRDLDDGRLDFDWAPARLVSDDPAKALGRAAPRTFLPQQLQRIVGRPETALDLVSAYFVPGTNGTEELAAMARRGVRVRVLTNALESTDVAAVHAGYAKRRHALLEAGVSLYELRRGSAGPPVRRAGVTGGSSGSSSAGGSGSAGSSASLHTKTFAVDGARAFVGSFNFDPRSARLNTEMGLVIDSPALASRIDAAFDGRIKQAAYEVRLAEDGRLHWLERRASGDVVRHDTEPGTTLWQRAGISLLSVLPIDWLL